MNKIVLITGGSRGIGAEIARGFARLGDDVAITYNESVSLAEKVVFELKNLGINAFAFKCDVSKKSDVIAVFKMVKSSLGEVDILVNNAGIAHEGLFTDLSESEWDRLFEVNVKGIFNATQAVLPDMIRKKSGKIINISSMWGQVGASCEVAYSATKAAVIGLTKALAKEVAPSNINVNCVCPGVIKTDMLGSFSSDDILALEEQTPLGRIGLPIDIAEMVVFLASKKASFITGQVFGVNGGFVV